MLFTEGTRFVLLDLEITNFAIIDRLSLSFATGLTVLTGETGAGKSIIIDALGVVLGGKAGADMVREGAAQARVQATFDVQALLPDAGTAADDEVQDARSSLAAVLREHGLEPEEGMLILTREINASGRTVARINGALTPSAVLARVGRDLIDIHGQSDHLSLLRASAQLLLLDRFGGLMPERLAVQRAVGSWRQSMAELRQTRDQAVGIERRKDLIRYQLDELLSANLRVGEEEALDAERTVLGNTERLRVETEGAHGALSGDDDGAANITALLWSVERALTAIQRFDPGAAAMLEAVHNIIYQTEDLVTTLRGYREGLDAQPDRLAQIEERLDLLHRLRRKYGQRIDQLIATIDQLSSETETLEHLDERIMLLEQTEAAARAAATSLAEALSARREEASRRLCQEVEQQLAGLGMPAGRFNVELHRSPAADGVSIGGSAEIVAIDASGVDRCEFLVSTNLGETPKALAKVASGGETSRLMLALKTALASADAVPTLIFDEIDVGLGGRMGAVLGEKLSHLARRHQILCITHLPQLAAFGDEHLHVSKRVAAGRTVAAVRALAGEERVGELASMLGGHAISTAIRTSARDLVATASAWKRDPPREAGSPR